MEKTNKERLEKINKLKDRLIGKELLNSPQYSLWDPILVQVGKFWKELQRMKVKKAFIYSTLNKHKLATKQLAHLHKTPLERLKIAINFLNLSLEEALQAFKITDRYQTIILLQRVIEKEELIQKVHDKRKVLQEEIKIVYAIFKPLMDKGLPYFWDNENKFLKKDQYDNLIVNKRNDHSNFQDLEGNLRGEVLVANLGDVFELLNMIKKINFP